MTHETLLFLTVVLYGLVASQHAFYAIGLGAVQRRLGAPAYVELRNALDDVLRKTLPAVYVATLVATVLSLLLAGGLWIATALAALLVEAWLMLRRSVQINERIQTWTPEHYPADWETHRLAWLRVFRQRQIAVAVGFLSLLLGALSG